MDGNFPIPECAITQQFLMRDPESDDTVSYYWGQVGQDDYDGETD